MSALAESTYAKQVVAETLDLFYNTSGESVLNEHVISILNDETIPDDEKFAAVATKIALQRGGVEGPVRIARVIFGLLSVRHLIDPNKKYA